MPSVTINREQFTQKMESFLGYSIDSEAMLKVSITLMKIVIFLTVAVFFQVIYLRSALVYREYRKKNFIALWRPVLMESVAHVPEKLPHLNQKFIQDFVAEWNSLYEKLGGLSHDNLIEIARRLDVNRSAILMLVSRHPRIQLTGIITLGNMRVVGAWDVLSYIARSDHTILSMAAYRSLILIDSDRALYELLPILLKRLDWPPSMVARILKDTDSLKVCGLIAETCTTANDAQLANLIQYLNTLNCMCAHEVFREILKDENKHDDHVISLCLSELNDPTSIEFARKYTTSTRWHVRAHAATALGNIGSEEDIRTLISMTGDDEWWVRYRAAQALAKLPFVKVENLKGMQKIHPHKLAKQILSQVIAEQELI